MTDTPTPSGDQLATTVPAASQGEAPAAPTAPALATASAAPSSPGKGLAIAALILGIAALLGVAIPIINVFSAILALVGLVLGIVALTRSTTKGLPLSGTIVSGLALLLSAVFIAVYVAGFANVVNDARGDSSIVDEDDANAGSEPAPEEPAESGLGTRENPAPLGTTIEISEFGTVVYEVTMGPSTLNATEAVMSENMFNEAPPEGFQYALVPVTVTYLGDETGVPWVDLTIEFVTADGNTHTESDTLVVAPEPTFMDINDLYNGATGTGNIVIAIPIENAASGTWTVSTLFGDPFFFTAE